MAVDKSAWIKACSMKYFMKCSFFHKFLSRSFFILSKVFLLTKSLNTACALTEIKQNLLHWIFVFQDKGFSLVLSSY